MERSEEIAERVRWFLGQLNGVSLCAVTKTMPPEDINRALGAGVTEIGENRVQELLGKLDQIGTGARVNLIGRLQTNKVRQIIGKTALIQSVDRIELAREIAVRSAQAGIVTDILIQVSPAGEPQKGGIAPERVLPLAEECAALDGLRVRGLMAVMPKADDPETLRPLFRNVRRLYEELGRSSIPGAEAAVLSMGMSGDWRVAVEEGSTMVRIGRGIFGERA